jgi:hypothetical protein
LWLVENVTDFKNKDAVQTKIPKHWHVIISGWIDPYFTAFATMKDPSLQSIEGEEQNCAKNNFLVFF